MTFIDKKALLKRHGGELDMPEGPFGVTFCENLLFCEPFFEGNYLHTGNFDFVDIETKCALIRTIIII